METPTYQRGPGAVVLQWVGILLILGLGVGCGQGIDRTDGGTCSDGLTGWVPASTWVRESSRIHGYRYRVGATDSEMEFRLIDASGDQIGVLTTDQSTGGGSAPDGAMTAVFDGPGQTVSMSTTGRVRNSEYSTRAVLTDGSREVRIWADYQTPACSAEGAREGRPPCAVGLPTGESALLVPSCGLVATDRQTVGLKPQLRHLEYGVSAQADVTSSEVSGSLVRADESFVTRTAVSEGSPTEVASTERWLEQTGAGKLIDSDGARLLAASFADRPWEGEVQARRRECSDDGETSQSTLECQRTTRQSQSPCGDGGYDSGDWGDSGSDFGNGGGDSCSGGCATGDPHLTTLDGHSYDFQGAGEFTLVERRSGGDFEVQARMEPGRFGSSIPACEDVSIVTAVAATLGDGSFAVYGKRQPRLYIDGSPVSDPSADLTLPDGAVLRQPGDDSYVMQWPDGRRLEVDIDGGTLGVDLDLPASWKGNVRGLFGNFNGSTDDDFQTRTGQILETPVGFDALYDQYGASWRITPSSSLFSYREGRGPSSFLVAGFPDAPVQLADLPASKRREAQSTCKERDVASGTPMQWCLLDVACSGNGELADAHAESGRPEATSHPSVTTSGDIDHSGTRTDLAATSPQAARGMCGAPDPSIALVPEGAAATVPMPVTVDATPDARVTESDDLAPADMSAGTSVKSYMLHLQPTRAEGEILEGRVEFDRDVLGVMLVDDTLAAADSIVGLQNGTYPGSGVDRGVDWEQADHIDIETRSVDVALTADDTLDQIRVLVRGDAP